MRSHIHVSSRMACHYSTLPTHHTHDHLPFRTTILINPGIVPVLITSISQPIQPVRGTSHKRRGDHRHSIGTCRQECIGRISPHIGPAIHEIGLTITATYPLHKPSSAHHAKLRTHHPSTPTPPCGRVPRHPLLYRRLDILAKAPPLRFR